MGKSSKLRISEVLCENDIVRIAKVITYSVFLDDMKFAPLGASSRRIGPRSSSSKDPFFSTTRQQRRP
jgi:hypothetical protein